MLESCWYHVDDMLNLVDTIRERVYDEEMATS